MNAPAPAETPASLHQASAWFARLRTRSVSAETLEAFRLWRKQPGNREAYAQVEKLWSRTGQVQDSAAMTQAITDALARADARAEKRGGRFSMTPTRLWLGSLVIALAGAALAFGPGFIGQTYDTGVGEQRTVRLADGSRLQLDTDTVIRVRLSAHQRRVTLDRGQAFFDVAHDAKRPFTVTSGTTSVRALGTRFDVRREAQAVRVTLVEGRVLVRPTQAASDAGVVLTPGQQLATGAGASHPRKIDVAAATSWRSGRVVFQAVPLHAAVAEINRYSQRKVVLEPGPAADALVSGAFDSGDLNAFVSAICELHGLKAVTANPDVIVLKAAVSPVAG